MQALHLQKSSTEMPACPKSTALVRSKELQIFLKQFRREGPGGKKWQTVKSLLQQLPLTPHNNKKIYECEEAVASASMRERCDGVDILEPKNSYVIEGWYAVSGVGVKRR
jgi:hypothetical protein